MSTTRDPVSTDRLLIRGIVAAAVVVSAVADTGGQPLWAAVVGWVAVCVVVALLVRSVLRDRNAQSWGTQVSTLHATSLMAASVVAACAFHGGATVWLPYVGVAAAAMSQTPALVSALIALPSVATLGLLMWLQTHNAWAVCINMASAAAVFVFVQLRRRQREAAELAASQREIIAAERARTAVADQQREISAQLHDVLAHTLSGLIITLQGATLMAQRESSSAELTDTLRTATTLARDGLGEARAAVESLRDDSMSDQPEALAPWLAKTLRQLRSGAGLDVEVSGDVEDLAPRWRDLARSVLMEGLTNSMRHAAGAPVRIVLTKDVVQVTSIGDPTRFVDRGHASGGRGLTGLAERVSAAGGTLHYGSTAAGFELSMHMGTGRSETGPMDTGRVGT